jgi:hypothetical protein
VTADLIVPTFTRDVKEASSEWVKYALLCASLWVAIQTSHGELGELVNGGPLKDNEKARQIYSIQKVPCR